MPTAPTISRDPTLEAHVFWYRFRNEILATIGIVLVALIGYGGYRFYSNHRESAAADLLGNAKTTQQYQQVIDHYGDTNAGATAYLLLAQAQRSEGKFSESNNTLQAFVDKNLKHEFIPTARMAIAANLESMGKVDEALATYQRVAADYPKSFDAPMALIMQVSILKAKKQDDAARRICETVLTQYRESIWASEAMRELRSLKPPALPPGVTNPAGSTAGPGPGNVPPMLVRPPSAPPPVPSGASPAAPPKPKP